MSPPAAPSQLQLRLFEQLRQRSGPPADRDICRALLDTVLTERFYLAAGRRVSAESVHHIGVQLFLHADPAGVVGQIRGGQLIGIPAVQLARECRMHEVTARHAVWVLERLTVARRLARPSRRVPFPLRMHVDGLDWRGIRRWMTSQRRRRPAAAPEPELPLSVADETPPTPEQIERIRVLAGMLDRDDIQQPEALGDASVLIHRLERDLIYQRAADHRRARRRYV